MGKLDGKVALVTGGAGGIGRATCEEFLKEGARVIVADITDEAGQKVAAEMGSDALYLHLDVTCEERWQQVMDEILTRFGQLDILVNNAGIGGACDLEDIDMAFWNKTMSINLTGVFLGCKHGVKAMKQSGGGAIINMSSITGNIGVSDVTAYSTSKGGVRMMSKCVALYCCSKGYGIRCNSVHPTIVETDMLMKPMMEIMGDEESIHAALSPMVPLGRMAQPQDIAKAISFLACDDATMITGTELMVDGGTTAGIVSGLAE